ncbi:PKD domain-containing protein [Amycolatopsis cihanbeyliensis]|uniref:PKD domain-containing protein n=2 Tax=Amycolatopsis cihanbeyliensis TaxID=1128664 RepID=A0A542DNC3_AMYCI|nr:PKD domain-containing protein [Amycolatopsis cihanbeyliensis]
MRRMSTTVAVAVATLAAGFAAPVAAAAPQAADLPNGAPDISTEAVMDHLRQFQNIAETQGNGNRCTGSGGYTGSVDYVMEKTEAAGYTVTEQPFSTWSGQSSNVLAELPGQDTSKVLMLGGHLDSVCRGPGINDNGTGSAGILAVAEAFAAANPNPPVTVRFGWWGDEEAGLNGSKHYAGELSGGERDRIEAYLNFDMIGSPNAGYFVYNDDDPAIEQTIKDYYVDAGVPTEGQSVGGRSDSASFQRIGIKTGGIFTGAEQRKTQAQADKWGGQAGVAYDRCYHQSCDTMSNLNETALGHNVDAISWALWELAGGSGGTPTDPRASFSADCSETEPSCAFDGSASSDPDGSVASYAWDFGDGEAGSGVSPSHTYVEAGTYSVELTVTDDEGNTGSTTKQVTAGGPPQSGEPPQASVEVSCYWDECSFDGTRSTDADGDIASYAWDFGDGRSGSGSSTTHTYPNRQATYTAELTVTDAAGNSDTASQQVQCWNFGSQAYCFAQ